MEREMHSEGLTSLVRFRQTEKRLAAAASLMNWLALLVWTALGIIVLQALLPLPPALRLALLTAALLFMLLSGLYLLWRPLTALFRPHEPSLNSIALRLGSAYPGLQDRLANALQLAALPEKERANLSSGLLAASAASIAAYLEQLDFSRHLDRTALRRTGRRLLLASGMALLAAALMPRTLALGLERTLYPNRDLARQFAHIFTVLPGNQAVLRGEAVTIRAWTGAVVVGDLQIEIDRFGRIESLPMTRSQNDTFRYLIPALRDSLYYRIRYQKAVSARYLLRAVDLPMVRSLRLRLQPPSYSGAEPYLLEENIGDVTALKGTTIDWQGEANKPLAAGQLIFSSGRRLPLAIAGRHLSTSFALIADEEYFSELRDQQGMASDNPITYRLRLLADQPPLVRLLSPGRDVDLREDMQLPLLIQAQDDYGVARMFLHYQVTGDAETAPDSGRFTAAELKLGAPSRSLWNVSYNWDLSGSPLLPTEVLHYFVQVFDNDLVSGPKEARTEIFRARFPSIYEIFQEVNDNQDETIAGMQENLERNREMVKKVEDLALQMQRTNELSWQKKQEIDETMQQQRELQQNLRELAERLDEVVARMEENRLLSAETLQKYQELQELYREIMTPELRKAMEKVAEAMEKMDPDMLQKSLEELKLSEEELNKNLDRTLSLLKRLRMEQQVDQAIRMTEELRERQQELTSQAQQKSGAERDKLAAEERALEQEAERLEEFLEELQEQMKAESGMPREEVAAARSELGPNRLAAQMQAMQAAMQMGDAGEMQKQSGEIQSTLQKAQNQLQQAKDKMTGAMTQRAMRAMQQGMRNLLALSRLQEELLQQGSSTPESSARIPEAAERQQQLAASLERVTNDLFEASKESFGISPRIGQPLGQAQQAMQQALAALEGQRMGQAGDRQGEAMSALNESVLQLDAAMQSMSQNGGSGMSMSQFMQQMQSLAQGQQGINAQTQGLGSMGQQMTLAQQAALSRLAAEQGQVRKSLEQLARESAGISELLGDLQNIGAEMRQVEQELSRGQVSRQTIDRQNRILSRMLDSQKSMQEREQSRQRKAETGKRYNQPSPAELPADLGQRRDRLQEDLLRAREEGYNRDYLELIKKYFESVGRHEDKP